MRSVAIYVLLGLTAFALVRCSVPEPAPEVVVPAPPVVAPQEAPPQEPVVEEPVRSKREELEHRYFSRAAPGWKKKKVKKKGDID